jgi:hypothetical protein
METQVEQHRSRTPIVRKAFAGLVLIVAAALAVKILIGFAIAIFGTIVLVAAVLAVIWALKTIVW